MIDLSGSSADEWFIATEPNHIFYFSFITNNDVDEHLVTSPLLIKLF